MSIYNRHHRSMRPGLSGLLSTFLTKTLSSANSSVAGVVAPREVSPSIKPTPAHLTKPTASTPRPTLSAFPHRFVTRSKRRQIVLRADASAPRGTGNRPS